MSTSPFRLFDDISMIQNRIKLTNSVLTSLHGALAEISKCEVSEEGAIDMKAIAESTLCEVQKMSHDHFQGGKVNAV